MTFKQQHKAPDISRKIKLSFMVISIIVLGILAFSVILTPQSETSISESGDLQVRAQNLYGDVVAGANISLYYQGELISSNFSDA